MIDGVPYATGRGYLLKAISTFLASYPTYSDFASALVAGTLPIDISFNSAGWGTQPTPLNKANLLDDTVAAALKTLAGLSSDPATPNAALSALATAVAGGAKIATGSYTGNGLYGSSHPCSLTFPFPPRFVAIKPIGAYQGGNVIFIRPDLLTSYTSYGFLTAINGNMQATSDAYAMVSAHTVSFYRSGGIAETQANASGVTYGYVALG